jgi:hypothetical protein
VEAHPQLVERSEAWKARCEMIFGRQGYTVEWSLQDWAWRLTWFGKVLEPVDELTVDKLILAASEMGLWGMGERTRVGADVETYWRFEFRCDHGRDINVVGRDEPSFGWDEEGQILSCGKCGCDGT